MRRMKVAIWQLMNRLRISIQTFERDPAFTIEDLREDLRKARKELKEYQHPKKAQRFTLEDMQGDPLG